MMRLSRITALILTVSLFGLLTSGVLGAAQQPEPTKPAATEQQPETGQPPSPTTPPITPEKPAASPGQDPQQPPTVPGELSPEEKQRRREERRKARQAQQEQEAKERAALPTNDFKPVRERLRANPPFQLGEELSYELNLSRFPIYGQIGVLTFTVAEEPASNGISANTVIKPASDNASGINNVGNTGNKDGVVGGEQGSRTDKKTDGTSDNSSDNKPDSRSDTTPDTKPDTKSDDKSKVKANNTDNSHKTDKSEKPDSSQVKSDTKAANQAASNESGNNPANLRPISEQSATGQPVANPADNAATGRAATDTRSGRSPENSGNWKIMVQAESRGILTSIFRVKVDDQFVSLVDKNDFGVVKTIKKIDEGKRKREMVAEFDRAKDRVKFVDTDMVTNKPVTIKDQVSLNWVTDICAGWYVMRAQQMEVGKTFTIPISDNGDIYTIDVVVLDEDRIDTDLGKFDTYRLEMKIFDGKFIRRKGKLILWVTKDERHIPLRAQIKSSFGTVNANIVAMKNVKKL